MSFNDVDDIVWNALENTSLHLQALGQNEAELLNYSRLYPLNDAFFLCDSAVPMGGTYSVL